MERKLNCVEWFDVDVDVECSCFVGVSDREVGGMSFFALSDGSVGGEV